MPWPRWRRRVPRADDDPRMRAEFGALAKDGARAALTLLTFPLAVAAIVARDFFELRTCLPICARVADVKHGRPHLRACCVRHARAGRNRG